MVATHGRRWLSVDRLGAQPEAVLRRATRQVVEVSALHTQPHRANLGNLDPLIELLANGRRMLPPAAVITAGKGYTVIGGERRAAAQLAVNPRALTLHVVRTWEEFFAWLLVDIDEPGERLPMNVVDAAWWFDKVGGHLKTRKYDVPQDVMAEYLDLELQHVRNVLYQLKWLRPGVDEAVRKYAAEQLDLVVRGEIASGTVDGRIARFVERRNRMPLRQQETILIGAAGQLAGIADALRPLATSGVSPELDEQTRENALRHFAEGRLQIERVIKALKVSKGSNT